MELNTSVETNFNSTEIFETDQKNIFKYFISLNSNLISEFLKSKDVKSSGSKKNMIKQLNKELEEGTITHYDLLQYLESVELYGKQHVILYTGPVSDIEKFRNKNEFMKLMEDTEFINYLNASLPISFPRELQIASIIYSENEKLEIYAIEAHYHLERHEEKDSFEVIDGQEIEFRAHTRNLRRGIMVFRWDLVVNNAILQIMQLPRGYSYEKIEEKFSAFIRPLIDLNWFSKIDLSSVISRLHELEESEHPETRSHGLGYKTFGGRSVSAHSPSDRDNLLGGEEFVDSALSNIREDAIGHTGNFYWVTSDETEDDNEETQPEDPEENSNDERILPESENDSEREENNNPLTDEIRTLILASKNRINFSTPHKREELEYVLRRVRELSQSSS